MKHDLVFVQKKTLEIVRRYFANRNSPFINKSYFALYDNGDGCEFIKNKIYKFKKKKIKKILLESINILNKSNLKIYSNNQDKKYFNNLIITWGNNASFFSDGSFYDKYFSTNSLEYQNTYWIIISNRKIKNKKINDNIAIIYPDKDLLNYFNFLKIFFLNLYNSFFGFRKKIIDQDFIFAKKINDFILKKKNLSKIKKLLMPYEGQAFQKRIFFKQKSKNKNLTTYGFDHSAPHSLATQLYYTEGSPDKLLVSGANVKKIYSKNYNWPSKKIELVFPARYKNFNKNDFINKMFLPHEFSRSDRIIDSLDFFLKNSKNKSIKNFSVNIHPIKKDVKRHIDLKKKIENVKKKYKEKFYKNSNQNMTIAVGFTTTPIVALEYNLSVLHICPNPDFDVYSDYFWPDIKVQRINKYCFMYNLKKFGSYLNFKNKNNILEIINDKKN